MFCDIDLLFFTSPKHNFLLSYLRTSHLAQRVLLASFRVSADDHFGFAELRWSLRIRDGLVRPATHWGTSINAWIRSAQARGERLCIYKIGFPPPRRTAPAGRVSLKRTSPTGTCWWNRVLTVPERLQNKLLLSSLTLWLLEILPSL